MDAKKLNRLFIKLRAHKRRGDMPDGTSKRARVNTPSSTAPVNTTAPIEAIAATEATVPLVSSSPPTEV